MDGTGSVRSRQAGRSVGLPDSQSRAEPRTHDCPYRLCVVSAARRVKGHDVFTERRKASSICVLLRRGRQRHTLTTGKDRLFKPSSATLTRPPAHPSTHAHTRPNPPKMSTTHHDPHVKSRDLHKTSHFQMKTEGGSRTVFSGKWSSLFNWVPTSAFGLDVLLKGIHQVIQ